MELQQSMTDERKASIAAWHEAGTEEQKARRRVQLEASKKSGAKHHGLGWNPLNSWFPGCEGHHINLSDVIYIPKAMHDSVRHNVWTGKRMAEMNALAGAFLTEDWT